MKFPPPRRGKDRVGEMFLTFFTALRLTKNLLEFTANRETYQMEYPPSLFLKKNRKKRKMFFPYVRIPKYFFNSPAVQGNK
jgi:hypothetical protein